MRKSYLVLGSTGFIGTNLVQKLISEGETVVSFSTRDKSQFRQVNHIKGDIRDTGSIKKVLNLKPNIIVSLVGISGQVFTDLKPNLSYEINVTAHIQLLDLILKYCPYTKFIFSSSRLEYGKPKYLPVDEKHPIQPISHYGIQKNLVSSYCTFLNRKYGLDISILRTSNPYGPHLTNQKANYNIVNYFVDQSLRGRNLTIFGTGIQKRDYLYIDDFIDALIRVSKNKKSRGNIYNIGSGRGISLVKVAQEIGKNVPKTKIVYQTWPSHEKIVETGDYISDISKIKRELKWTPTVSLQQGIKKVIRFQKSL